MKNNFFVLREIYENKIINKDQICYRYNITYMQFDNVLYDLFEKYKYINSVDLNSEIKITTLGMEFLNKYKVDRAIILASGLGSRMGEKTITTSKCLFKIKNEVLVERLIKQFKEIGINDVIVLIGYCKEQFYYLKDKYNVTLVENEEYNTKNTIASFYHVIDKIENCNCYISVGDIYINDNAFHLFEYEPYYIGPYLKNCKNEWVYDYDINNKVYGVLDGDICDYYLGGFSFHTKEFANAISKKVREAYNKEGTEKLYWEDLLVRNFDNLPDFYIHKLPYGVLTEYDSINDIINDKTEKEEVLSAINKIFYKNDDNLIIEKINSGFTNKTYKVELNNKKYVIRIPGISSQLFIDRKIEKEVYSALDKYDITDKMIYFDDEGIKASMYIDGSCAIDIKNDYDINNAMLLYSKLHKTNIKVNYDVDVISVFKSYLSLMEKYKFRFIYDDIEDFDSINYKCKKIIDFIGTFERPKVLCHGDAASINVLKKGNLYKLIDFEYAGMADPLTDLALFSVFSDFDFKNVKRIYDIYKSCSKGENLLSDDNKMLSLVIAYMAINSISCVLCEIIRTSILQKNFKIYCDDRIKLFNRCYDCLYE